MPPPFIPNLCSALNPQRLDLVRLQVDLVLGERNEEAHLFAPFSPANLAHKPKGGPPPEAGSARRLRLSFDGPVPVPPARAPQLSFGEEDAMMENNHHHHAAADSVDADPSRAALYDPKTNYTSPRRRFLHNKPNPRIEMYRHGGSAARRLDEGLASESSEESVTTTTDDDLTEEEQEQVQQQIPEESSALAAAPSEAEDAAAVPDAVPCVFPPEPALGSPRVPVLTSEPAAASPPVRVLASQPASPRTPVSKQIVAHTATINDISFEDREYIGSCSDDGTVVISNLFSDEKLKFEYHRPMKAIALDPEYSRNYKRFATGGLAGQVLVLTKKSSGGGYNKKVLREGEGLIHSMKWRADLLAWANDAGVKVHDMRTDRGIAFVERPKGIPRPEVLLPHLVWQDDTVLVIGWGTSVKIAAIRTESQGLNGLQRSISAAVSDKYVDIVGSFQTGYHISGISQEVTMQVDSGLLVMNLFITLCLLKILW